MALERVLEKLLKVNKTEDEESCKLTEKHKPRKKILSDQHSLRVSGVSSGVRGEVMGWCILPPTISCKVWQINAGLKVTMERFYGKMEAF